MKTVKLSLEAHIWYREPIKNPYDMLPRLFNVVIPSELKQYLSELMVYTHKSEIYHQENPHVVFLIYSVLRSIVRGSYKIRSNSSKYYTIKPLNKSIVPMATVFLGALSFDEYLNPYLVFDDVFEKQSVIDIEIDLFEIIEFALGNFIEPPSVEINVSFINVNRLIEACWLICERME
ncbi:MULTISPECIES: hypothetical protein [Myroides]|uniref:hypothetical protein n=1 Tax=Myroides TaxID=76831 RepID=UPI0015FA77E3|nr:MULTISPECIES: hypothetical protein [Myroides]MBB1139030.1 hypothetical protein [Myroides sp. WP-1]MDM1035946.1 hypothetical protein [Myroides odoratimimus]MDM1060133.1 hypothetical protein [Myroides odoratimimus]